MSTKPKPKKETQRRELPYTVMEHGKPVAAFADHIDAQWWQNVKCDGGATVDGPEPERQAG